MIFFKKAIPLSAPIAENASNLQLGFYHCLHLDTLPPSACIRIAAANVYRLYINGQTVMHGPARTAHGYARVDQFDILPSLGVGDNHIAVELSIYGKHYGAYSNDSTLEPGFLQLEIFACDTVLCATLPDDWRYTVLTQRHADVDRISHCREWMEIYTPDSAYLSWRIGESDTFYPTCPSNYCPRLLPRAALLPSLDRTSAEKLIDFGGCRIDPTLSLRPLFYEKPDDTSREHPLADCRRTLPFSSFDVNAVRTDAGMRFCGECDRFALYDLGESHVGFFEIDISFDCDGILDVVHTELLDTNGDVFYPFNSVTRLHLCAGRHRFTAMEPSLTRYLKLYMRTTGNVTLHALSFLDYTYPDQNKSAFLCADESLNRIYDAAKRTLLLNTMDIFMDCPDRERGGWLCDSLWTARAAAMMLSDTRVEREFLENFLLTDPDCMWNAFFPEVYPANKESYLTPSSITTWSFWLMCELCEYVRRTGDRALANTYRDRVVRFVNGSLSLIGEHGCLENLPLIFIDWSLSNRGEHLSPISVAANALYAYMLSELGALYDMPEWTQTGTKIREILRTATATFPDGETDLISDNLVPHADASLHQTDKYSEAALYTTLWSGLWERGERPALDIAVRDKMGPAPLYAPYPVLGRSGLFIGLCIRLDLLARHGAYAKMLEDLRAIYEPQLREGPGTLWENSIINTSSRCHGFNSHAGVHLMRDLLGIGMPDAIEHTVTISPHPLGVRWARGSVELDGQLLSVSWNLTDTDFFLRVQIPEGWFIRFELPPEIKILGDDHIHLLTEEGEVSV